MALTNSSSAYLQPHELKAPEHVSVLDRVLAATVPLLQRTKLAYRPTHTHSSMSFTSLHTGFELT